jgi:hypothetical protein
VLSRAHLLGRALPAASSEPQERTELLHWHGRTGHQRQHGREPHPQLATAARVPMPCPVQHTLPVLSNVCSDMGDMGDPEDFRFELCSHAKMQCASGADDKCLQITRLRSWSKHCAMSQCKVYVVLCYKSVCFCSGDPVPRTLPVLDSSCTRALPCFAVLQL